MKFISSPPAPGTAQWRRTITASKVPIIAGLFPWKTRQQLFNEMTGRAEPPAATKGMNLGKSFEPAIIDAAIMRQWPYGLMRVHLPHTVTTTGRLAGVIGAETPEPMTATVDGWGHASRYGSVLIEAKLVADRPEDWADGVPAYVNAQVQFQLVMADEVERALVIALMPDFELEIFVVERDEALADWLVTEALLWREHLTREMGEENE